MTTTSPQREAILTALAEQHTPLFGHDQLADTDTVAALYHDHMDWHNYLHLRGFATEQDAWEFLSARAGDEDSGEEFVAVGVLQLTGPVEQAFRAARIRIVGADPAPISAL